MQHNPLRHQLHETEFELTDRSAAISTAILKAPEDDK
jgi:hypothetical protein